MSIDVEDWFHVQNLNAVIARETWGALELRVERNMDRMLGLMADKGVRSTCFVLGWIADRCPSLIRRIASEGHEIASHGYGHEVLSALSRDGFRTDVRRSKQILEDLTGAEVTGYRAPNFSITDWSIPILEEEGFTYDSSAFPTIVHDRYGRLTGIDTDRPVVELRPGFHEVFVSCLRVGSTSIPWGGGAYFRLIPYPVFRRGVSGILRTRPPYVFYIHPWEIDPDQPQVDGVARNYRFRHYVGLERCERRFTSLLEDFQWSTMSELLGAWTRETEEAPPIPVDRSVTLRQQRVIVEPDAGPRHNGARTTVAGFGSPMRSGAKRAPGRPLRIAHVNANLAAGSGGITLREALALDPDRHTTTILAPGDGTLFAQAERQGLRVVRLRRMGGGRHVYPWADGEALRELCEQLSAGAYDVVHTHAGRAGAVGRIAARRVGVPAIVHTLHGFPFNEFQSLPTRRALQAIERGLGRITDWFLTDGTFVASEAVRLKIAPPDRIRALISPIDSMPQVTDAARRRARRRLGLPGDAKVIGTTARLVRQKGPLDMVDAIAALRRADVRMVWVGDGDLRPEVERRIAERGLGDRFRLLGDRDDVPDLLPAFDVLAMSSLWEGLPCSVVEAMTCGIPVVATAVNSVPEVVIPGRTGLLARPRDAASLSRALAYMLDHPADAARMAAAARDHVGEQFRSDVLGEELMDVYHSALRHGARHRGVVAAEP